ncbi:MAG: hypothetical protein LBS45_07095 [Synergistaceae bacterium]|nr:hypothetical protein [Synergistaceae bacterium]
MSYRNDFTMIRYGDKEYLLRPETLKVYKALAAKGDEWLLHKLFATQKPVERETAMRPMEAQIYNTLNEKISGAGSMVELKRTASDLQYLANDRTHSEVFRAEAKALLRKANSRIKGRLSSANKAANPLRAPKPRARAHRRPTRAHGSSGGSSGGSGDSGDGGSDSPGPDQPDPPAPIARAQSSHSVTPHSKKDKLRYYNRRVSRRSWFMAEGGRAA